jgi:hypothetical protein
MSFIQGRSACHAHVHYPSIMFLRRIYALHLVSIYVINVTNAQNSEAVM